LSRDSQNKHPEKEKKGIIRIRGNSLVKKLQHTGIVKGADDTKGYKVKIRETKTLWITSTGCRYRKSDGSPTPYNIWNTYFLDLSSIKPI